jgi:DNA polymerase-3 subunit delta
MNLRSEQDLDKLLERGAPPLILIHSDAPLLREEAVARVRRALTADPEVERHAFRADEQIDYAVLRQELAAPSLFAPRRLFELHYGSDAPKDEGGKWLQEVAADPPPDVWLVISCGYQSKRDQKKKWFQAVASAGATLALFAPRRHELGGWLKRRLAGYGLELDRDGLALLAERVEGNLEAAAGEVEKLALFAGSHGDNRAGATLGAADVLAAVGDQARFSVFDLAEAALTREPARCARAVAALRAEGVALPPVIGALAKEVRNLIALQGCAARGEDLEAACTKRGIFPPRKQAIQKLARSLPATQAELALVRLARADRVAKGAAEGDGWALVEAAVLALAGAGELPALRA